MAQVAPDPEWGYLRLDPLPDPDELSAFYESGYYDLLRRGERAPDLARLQQGGEAAEREREWLRRTVHADFIHWAPTHQGGPCTVLEVGSGTGDLLASFVAAGWAATGLEPAAEVAAACRARGLDVHPATLEQFVETNPGSDPDVVILRLVLEHVRDPIALLRTVHACLRDGGLVIVEVPNDFNALQEAARRKHDLDAWWVAAPDHLNYFDFTSLGEILERVGFRVTQRSTTFPMELFLLMGDNYVADASLGRACHSRRRELELSIGADVRRSLYGAMAQAGLGRTCVMAAVAS